MISSLITHLLFPVHTLLQYHKAVIRNRTVHSPLNGEWPFKGDVERRADVGRLCALRSRCHPHHGLQTAAAATKNEQTSEWPFPSQRGDGRKAETEAPVEGSAPGEKPPHATPVSSMSSSKATYSHLTKRGANPGGSGGGGSSGGRNMNTNKDYSINLSVQQVLSLWVQGTTLQHFTGMPIL